MNNESAKLFIRVQPNAKENKLDGFKEGILHIRIAAPPVEGKANEAVIKFLSKQLGVSKSKLSIERGLTGRTKTILIFGMSRGEVEKRLWELSQ